MLYNIYLLSNEVEIFSLTLHIGTTLHMSKYIVYTYQFAPLQNFPSSLFEEENIQTPEQVMARKQEIFSKLLCGVELSFRLEICYLCHSRQYTVGVQQGSQTRGSVSLEKARCLFLNVSEEETL